MAHVYVDFDDVLTDTISGIRRLALAKWGKDVPYESVFDFDLRKTFNLSDDEMMELVGLTHDRDFLGGLAPLPGACECLLAWRAAGHDVAVVTGRPPHSQAYSLLWLERHGVAGLELIHWDKYRRYRTEPSASDEDIRAMNFDFFVDDAPAALSRIAGLYPQGRVAILDKPWNRTFVPMHEGMRRCLNWQDVGRYFKESI